MVQILMSPHALKSTTVPSPFFSGNEDIYREWREQKLAGYPTTPSQLTVRVSDPAALTPAEHAAMSVVCAKANMVIYEGQDEGTAGKDVVHALGRQFGLTHLDPNMLADDDGVTSLEVVPGKATRGYIPYTNRRLLWHTDGYYNRPERYIRAFILHCVRPADSGGENSLLDPEIAYIQIRDRNPDFIRALMAPDAMTIPPNTEAAEQGRGAETGPVFSIDAGDNLHMRYTARTRSIEWKADPLTREAVACLAEVLETDSPYRFTLRLRAGQGLLCNNVLHNRTAFTDDLDKGAGRLIYRARYYDRIAGTNLSAANG